MKQINRFCPAILVAGLLCLGLMFGTNASAADKNPCSEDIAKFCKDVKPDIRSIMDCLEEHENKLSDACKDFEATMGGSRVESREKQGNTKRSFRPVEATSPNSVRMLGQERKGSKNA
jgi:hypothetical protein